MGRDGLHGDKRGIHGANLGINLRERVGEKSGMGDNIVEHVRTRDSSVITKGNMVHTQLITWCEHRGRG